MSATDGRLVIVSGLSGAGKTLALQTLEDLGYYTIDNFPIGLLASFIGELVAADSPASDRIAVGIDARSPIGRPEDLAGVIRQFSDAGLACEQVFLEASDEILIKRYSETRRKHPLSAQGLSLTEAIQQERRLLEPLAEGADIHIDTSHSNLHQLRDLVRERVDRRPFRSLSLMFMSFGFKHGVPPDVDFVFDTRCLPNPHWEARLRALTGKDEAVVRFLSESPLATQMFEQTRDLLEFWVPHFEADNRNYLTVAWGCTGGQHRSVYMAEKMYAWFSARRDGVLVRHRELGWPMRYRRPDARP